MSSCFWDEKTEETFYYSSFPWIQGRILRGAIKYLATLDENPILDIAALRAAGVPVPDSARVEDFQVAITEALALLNSWVREPGEVDDIVSQMFGRKSAWAAPSVSESQSPLSDILNTPFFIEKVAEMNSVCPQCLAKLGLEGVFLCMEISEDKLEVSPGGAKAIVDALDRLESYTDWGGWEEEDSEDEDEEEVEVKKTPGEQMRIVFAACAANPESSIVA
ncbi:hypothetical protein R3P38DRAFT_3257992 [Favolaschia claudopus]|uniref:Uncharacterized protein n=1 Tax=Favolaschia claudopus TaxID=2862362 RepID=A0AAW0D6D5_9AGAR